MINQNGSILLVITGSIAAVKAYDLVRGLLAKHISVDCVLTHSAQEFVPPMALSALLGKPVYTELWDEAMEAEIGHIQLSRRNDLVVVAPATANILAKMAHGLADDLASTLLLATDKPVLVAPAMNVRMWHHSATQRNVAQLKQDGIEFIGPAEGMLACGEQGFGRMVEVDAIIESIEHHLTRHSPNRAAIIGESIVPRALPNRGSPYSSAAPTSGDDVLKGKKVLITAGPTQEPIDPVRYISNHSSGKQGYAIAQAIADAGAEVTLVSGPTNLAVPQGVKLVPVITAEQMLTASLAALPVDIAICTAAVADWKVMQAEPHKVKKSGKAPSLKLTENPDILHRISTHEHRPKLVIGFAAKTENLLGNAAAKRVKKGCDWLIANNVKANAIFGADDTDVHLVTQDAIMHWGPLPKREVANKLTEAIAIFFRHPAEGWDPVTRPGFQPTLE